MALERSAESREGDLELVRRGLDAFNSGDTEALLALFDPEIEVYMPPEIPNAARVRGHEQYLAWQARWLGAWDDFQVSPKRLEPIGDRHVVLLAHQTATGKGSGIPVEMDIAYMWELRDGKGPGAASVPDVGPGG